jgi:putative transport protein
VEIRSRSGQLWQPPAARITGPCGNPAILAYANKLTLTDAPDIGYAMIFPGMTIVKILFMGIVSAFC